MSEQKKKRGVWGVFLSGVGLLEGICNALFALLYLLALLAPVVSPRVTQVPALLNLSFIGLLLALFLLFCFYLLRRKWWYVLGYFALFLLSSGYIFTYIPVHFGKGLNALRDLRVMSYNVSSFAFTDKQGTPLALHEIQMRDADIVALQEAPSLKYLKHTLGKQYSYVYAERHKSPALLSKYPILWSKEIEYPTFANGSTAHWIELPRGKHLLLVNNHMESYAIKAAEIEQYKRYLTEFKLTELPKQLLVVKNRLGPKLNQRAVAAEVVRKAVQDYARELQPDAIIVLGDLNDTPMSYTYAQLSAGRRDAFAETGLGLGVSFNARMMKFRIDHLFYSGSLDALGSSIPPRVRYSDHNPLIVDFRINEEPQKP